MSSPSNGHKNDGGGGDEGLSAAEDLGPNVHTSSHPVLSHKITILRSSNSSAPTFRAAMREVTFHLGYEATRNLTTKAVAVSVDLPDAEDSSPAGSGEGREHVETTGQKLMERCALIPVLRSGLGMTDAMQELLPNAASYHIGMYKSSKQSHPVMYYNRLPRQCASDVAFVLDPVIATASTVTSVVKLLKKWGVPKVHVITIIASRSGLKELLRAHPEISVTVGTIDETNDAGILVPGLGDAGDRLFGTIHEMEDDQALVHPTKRRRTESIDHA
jgi:uracil phosphoribosyltransferase